MKTAVYGTLLGLLNVKNHDVASKLFDQVVAATKEYLAKSDWRSVKYLVRFHGELVNANVILPAAYLDLLNDLLAALDEPNVIAVSTPARDGDYISVSNFPIIASRGLHGLHSSCSTSLGK